MRAFLGIPITRDIVPNIERIQKRFSDFDIKMVEKENFHFNIKFFGEIDEKTDSLKPTIIETFTVSKYP